MQRFAKMVGSGMLVVLAACSGGSSDSAESPTSSPAPASESASTPAPVTTALEGTWRSVLRVRDLERRGFSTKQIQLLQAHDEWSTRQANEIRVSGDTWVLSQRMDGKAPASGGDFGHISVTDERIRLDEGTCFLVLRYRLHEDAIKMTLVRSTCDDDPIEPIPDFMYAAVFGQPFQRQG